MMYGIEELLMDFTKDEIAAGAELAAMEQVELTVKEDDILKLEALVNDEQSTRNMLDKKFSSSVYIDENFAELIEMNCRCPEFDNDKYACRHITAAILSYFEQRDGRDSLANSEIGRILAEKTGVKEPFRKGILRKTDSSLADFLKKHQNRTLSLVVAQTERIESVHVECLIEVYRRGIRVELRAGQKRLYVIKNVKDFIEAYLKRQEVTLGKNTAFILSPEALDEKSRRRMEFFSRLYREAQDVSGNFFSGIYGQEYRGFMLSGRDIDLLMEVHGPDGIYCLENEKEKLYFNPEEKDWELQIKKFEFGAEMSLTPIEKVAQSLDWIYWKEGNQIYRKSVSESEATEEVISIFHNQKRVFIGESDLPAVCREIVPALNTSFSLTFEGMNLVDYLPEKPEFEIYLDHPQDNMITCKIYACYKAGKYQLFTKEDYHDNRDFAAEHAVGESVRRFFQSYDESDASLVFDGDQDALFDFLAEDIPKLETLGKVFISDRMNKLRVVKLTGITVGVSVTSGLMELSMKSDTFSRKELSEILSSYNRKNKYYRLKNGTFIAYDKKEEAMWESLSECLKYADKKNPENIRMPLFRALYLDEMLRERDNVNYNKSREYRRLLTNMRTVENGDFEVPESLESTLRNYQKDGLFWLKTLKANGFGGILADDMGLGKTLQVLSFLLSEKEEEKENEQLRTLIITPASLVYNWKKECEQFTPQLKLAVISGTAAERKILINNAKDTAEVWITSYDLLKRDIELYEGIPFANQVIDEAQYIKNQTTNVSRAVRVIQSGFRVALTGTPIENRLSELWSIFDYLMPGFLYTYSRFRAEIELPIVGNQDEEAMEKLRCMVHPFVLRRLKKDVLKDLPDKQEEVVYVEMGKEQQKLYDAHVQRLKMYLEKQSDEEFGHNKIEILAELTKLRQLCCGPELLMEGYKGGNAKLEACLELVQQAVNGGHKLLIFSQFTAMLDEICSALNAADISYYRIDGSVKKELRMEMVDAFQKDEIPVFCISLKAGGTGLNLTAADIVIHYDPWWNVAAQNQATDRTHRIGQTNSVNVYQLIAENTIEQKIKTLQENKHRLAEEVLSGEGIQSILINKEEVLSLL